MKVELGEDTRNARSINDLARIFWKTPGELLEANPFLGPDPDQALPEGTELDVPDPDFRPWVASRLAAAVVADPGLAPSEKARWIRRLVPAALRDPSALDAVLARLIAVSGLDPMTTRRELRAAVPGSPDDPPDAAGMYTLVILPRR
jgi:hypothetical protein